MSALHVIQLAARAAPGLRAYQIRSSGTLNRSCW
jgi:hypothetical protein